MNLDKLIQKWEKQEKAWMTQPRRNVVSTGAVGIILEYIIRDLRALKPKKGKTK